MTHSGTHGGMGEGTDEDRLRARLTRQRRLTRQLERRYGLTLRRSRRRDPLAPDFGRYLIVDPATSRPVAGADARTGRGTMTLDDVAAWLQERAGGGGGEGNG